MINRHIGWNFCSDILEPDPRQETSCRCTGGLFPQVLEGSAFLSLKIHILPMCKKKNFFLIILIAPPTIKTIKSQLSLLNLQQGKTKAADVANRVALDQARERFPRLPAVANSPSPASMKRAPPSNVPGNRNHPCGALRRF